MYTQSKENWPVLTRPSMAVFNLPGDTSMAAAFATITSKSGTAPPYRYAAVEATMDEDGAWTQVAGGAA